LRSKNASGSSKFLLLCVSAQKVRAEIVGNVLPVVIMDNYDKQLISEAVVARNTGAK